VFEFSRGVDNGIFLGLVSAVHSEWLMLFQKISDSHSVKEFHSRRSFQGFGELLMWLH